MAPYPLTWITDNIAVGHAPMSYDELDSLKEQGVNAIVNLCGEYCDLHEIEASAGFEVFFLPVVDEDAPQLAEMEAGLAWLDEAVYLGKKVLVHCRHGIGRTGTFVTAYLLRRGFTLKKAAKLLKMAETRANPSNFSQWWMLRKFGKKEGRLTIREPDPQNRRYDELAPFFARYERLLAEIDSQAGAPAATASRQCGCRHHQTMEIQLIEALYLHSMANIVLSADKRRQLFAEDASRPTGCEFCLMTGDGPLSAYRPATCRLQEKTLGQEYVEKVEKALVQLSIEVFWQIFAQRPGQTPPPVSLDDVASGRFIQKYFQ
ncbi:MAG: dual specificity protein phosphatase family protein, partial [Desulfopila sp.]